MVTLVRIAKINSFNITSKLVADLLVTAGTDRVLTVDLHAGQIQGFFNIPVDHLYAMQVMIPYLEKMKSKDMMVISPDAGGVERARAFAKRLDVNLAIIDKRREAANEAKAMNIIGDVVDKVCFVVDDMIDTAGTLEKHFCGVLLISLLVHMLFCLIRYVLKIWDYAELTESDMPKI